MTAPHAPEHAADADADADDNYYGVGFWLAVVVGALAIAYGISEYLASYPDVQRRLDLPKWIVGAALAHDLLLAPAVLLIGFGVARLVPPLGRGPVQAACLASGVVLLVAWHPLRHTAAAKHNASIQPLDYRTSTLTVLAVIWGLAAMWATVRRWRVRGPLSADTDTR